MKLAVIGSGTMGSGIAQSFITHGHEVILCDISEEFLGKAKKRLDKNISKLVAKEKLTEEQRRDALERIDYSSSYKLAGCSLIIEAIPENIQLKKELFEKLDKECPEETIFTSNTSSLSLTEMENSISRSITGFHFFNPVPVMKLVEITKSIKTTTQQVSKLQDIVSSIEKVPVISEEMPGFIVNRILIPMINEAIGVYAEGIASKEDIDAAMKLGANHPLGPLALGDLIGLDVCLAIMEVLHLEFGEDKYRPHPLLKKMVRGKLLGRKTNRGFYTYK